MITINDTFKKNHPFAPFWHYSDDSGIEGVPFVDVAAANAHNVNYRSLGDTCLIAYNGRNVEFWYGDGITDADLVPKLGINQLMEIFIGDFDASASATFPVNPDGTKKGDYWNVTATGTIDGMLLENINDIGDTLLAKIDEASPSSSSDWIRIKGTKNGVATTKKLGLVALATISEVNNYNQASEIKSFPKVVTRHTLFERLKDILQQGTNVTITGDGTPASPWVINSGGSSALKYTALATVGIAANTNEQDLIVKTLEAKYLTVNTPLIELTVLGQFWGAAGNRTLKVYMAGQQVFSGTVAITANSTFELKVKIYITDTTSWTSYAILSTSIPSFRQSGFSYSLSDLTQDNIIRVSGQSSNGGQNDIIMSVYDIKVF